MNWLLTNRADPLAARLADRHYTRQAVGSRQFVPPGRCTVLRTENSDAVWVTSWPFAEYVKHAWAGAWICSIFRNESAILSSTLIREALAVTRWRWPDVPDLGMITFIDTGEVRRKRDWGRCYRRAGFTALKERTQGGLFVLQMLPSEMPEPMTPKRLQLSMFG